MQQTMGKRGQMEWQNAAKGISLRSGSSVKGKIEGARDDLQKTNSNHDMLRKSGNVLQSKLVVGSVNDRYEQDADRVADQVTQTLESRLQRKSDCGSTSPTAGEGGDEFQSRTLLPKQTVGFSSDSPEREADGIANLVLETPERAVRGSAQPSIQKLSGQPTGQPDAIPASVRLALANPGKPLEFALRQDMEQRFGHDFRRVRMHTGADAEQSTHDVNAIAYTVGHDVVFRAGSYAPRTRQGRRLIAHELTHVVQQTAAQGVNSGRSTGESGPTPFYLNKGRLWSAEPENTGVSGQHLTQSSSFGRWISPRIQRQETPIEEQGPISAAQTAANMMYGLLGENILLDWWEGDCRDNDRNRIYDAEDPGERGFAGHINRVEPGFKTIKGRPCIGEGGVSVDIENSDQKQAVKYSVCAQLVSESYSKAGLERFPGPTKSTYVIMEYFRKNSVGRNPLTSWWTWDQFPGDFMPGDFISCYTGAACPHSGMVVVFQRGKTMPYVVHLPGTDQRIWSGRYNGLEPYDPRNLSDVTFERWPQAVRKIFGVGRYRG